MISSMMRFRGVGASRGIAIGPARLTDARVVIAERRILRADRDAELMHLEAGIAAADAQLNDLQQLVDGQHGGSGHEFVEVHRMILHSAEIASESRRLIADECYAAEWAVSQALERIRLVFSRLADPYFRGQGGDFEVVGERLLRVLLGLPEVPPGASASRGEIAVAVGMLPLLPFQLQRAGCLGIVSESGGATSSVAIAARALGLPYVVGIRNFASQVGAGAILIVDGSTGDVIVDPDEDCLGIYRRHAEARGQRAQQLATTRGLPAVTTDGQKIHLAANVASVAGVSAALSAGAESIGLLRTEFLYFERPDLPDEQEQYQDAVAALHAAGPLPVTFRTLDLAVDRVPLAVKIDAGANPTLGIRSSRFLLQRPDVLRAQLRALYRASATRPLRFMFPLVSGVTELRQLAAVRDEVRADLAREGIGHDPATPVGVMIETPSAALTADHLARRCDFLSIGTNDLIQYMFAADRDNQQVAYLLQPLHPAVLRSLKGVVDAANAAGVPVAICGDMAGDPFLTWILMGLGLRALSMDPEQIPRVKAVVRGSSLREAEALTKEALTLDSEAEVMALVQERLGDRFVAEMEGALSAGSGRTAKASATGASGDGGPL
jgi:phosphotransferase system enzyme I (PtsI)